MSELDAFVEGHLDLQVRISYADHLAFLRRHGLETCARILDVGTGNGAFVARLAQDFPEIQFAGIDKRGPCIESARKYAGPNLRFSQVDMFSRKSPFDFSVFDGFLLRYFLLHVDHAQRILERLRSEAKRPARVWVIDLDWSAFACAPPHPSFDCLTQLVKDFCSKVSVDSMGGQRVAHLLEQAGYQSVRAESVPFTTATIPLDEFARYLRQEVQCYARMGGQRTKDPDTLEVLRFIDEDVRTGKVAVSYGMVLVAAELT